MNRTAIFGLCVLALLLALNSWLIHQEKMKSGLGQVAAGTNSLPVNGAAAASDPPAAAPPFLGAEARPTSGQVAQMDSGSTEEHEQPTALGDAGSSPALATILDQYEFSTPTAEDLAWLTIDSWMQPEFLELTQEEAHELLALDDTMGLKGPGLMTSIAGPLPTLDDCRIGFRSQAVQDRLREVLLYEAMLIEFGEIPLERRSHWAEQRRLELCRMRDNAMVDLLKLLEEETTISTWRTWWRLWQRWSQ